MVFLLICLCLVVRLYAVPTVLPIEHVIVEDAEWCKTGYYWDYQGAQDDSCCSYHQCQLDRRDGLVSTKRYCPEPLIWNNVSCTCDFSFNAPVDDCKGDQPAECWVKPTTPSCEVVNANSQCCQVGQQFAAFSGTPGYLFEINGDDSSNYTFCPNTSRASEGRCPDVAEDTAGKFELSTCCCEKVPTDCQFYQWDFNDETLENPFVDVQCEVPLEPGQCTIQPTVGMNCPGGNGSAGDIFSKFYFGQFFTIIDVLDCSQDSCNLGNFFDNGNPDGKNPFEASAICNQAAGTVSCTIGDLSIDAGNFPSSSEVQILIIQTPVALKLVIVNGGVIVGEGEVAASGDAVYGTKCPLRVGGLEGSGITKQFFVYSGYAFTDDDVAAYAADGSLPTLPVWPNFN